MVVSLFPQCGPVFIRGHIYATNHTAALWCVLKSPKFSNYVHVYLILYDPVDLVVFSLNNHNWYLS